MKHLKALTLATGMAAAAIVPASAFQDEGTVRIGSTEPLTGPGAVYGQPTIIGKQIAIQEINAAGGIKSLDGAKIKLLTADSEGKPDLSIPAVERLDRQGVVAVTGCLQSSVTIVATQVAEKQRVPFVVSVAVADRQWFLPVNRPFWRFQRCTGQSEHPSAPHWAGYETYT